MLARLLQRVSSDRSRCGPPSSSGLGRRPFTAVARVRIPLGVPDRREFLTSGNDASGPSSHPAGPWTAAVGRYTRHGEPARGVLVQYWRSFEALEAYARNPDVRHAPVGRAWNRLRSEDRGAAGSRAEAGGSGETHRDPTDEPRCQSDRQIRGRKWHRSKQVLQRRNVHTRER